MLKYKFLLHPVENLTIFKKAHLSPIGRSYELKMKLNLICAIFDEPEKGK